MREELLNLSQPVKAKFRTTAHLSLQRSKTLSVSRVFVTSRIAFAASLKQNVFYHGLVTFLAPFSSLLTDSL